MKILLIKPGRLMLGEIDVKTLESSMELWNGILVTIL